MIFKKLLRCVHHHFWTNLSAKFIIVSSRAPSQQQIKSLYKFFQGIRRLNVIVFYAKFPSNAYTFNVLEGSIYSVSNFNNADISFPDKLRNLNRYNFKLSGTNQKPRLIYKNGNFYGFDVFFMEIVAQKQNATLSFDYYNLKSPESRRKFFYDMMMGKTDMNLNTMNSRESKPFNLFNTFDVGGYCALIPIPPRNSLFNYIFKPYDTVSWIFMIVCLITLVIVWRIFKAQRGSRVLNTAGHMVLLVIAGFLGQALRFRHTRWFHVLVVQCFVFMVMILGNAYQSLLISLITVSRNGTRITTIDEMVQRDYNYCSDQFIFNFLVDSQMKLPMFRMCTEMYENHDIDFGGNAKNGTVLVMRCDKAQDIFYTSHNVFSHQQPSEFYYILPEKFFTMYENLVTSRFSPFTDRFQDLSLAIFESGIKQHWKTLLHTLTDQIDLAQIAIMKEEFFLKIDDLKFVFYIWGCGLCLASFFLIMELLWFKHCMFIKKTWIFKTRQKRQEQREMMMAGRIEILPFEEM